MSEPRIPSTPQTATSSDPAGISRRELITGAAAAATLLASRRTLGASKQPARIFRIHPAINVARAGNASPDVHYVGPEVPGQGPVELSGAAVTQFKVAGQGRPQAARFRVYEYADFGHGLVPFQEVTLQTAGIKD